MYRIFGSKVPKWKLGCSGFTLVPFVLMEKCSKMFQIKFKEGQFESKFWKSLKQPEPAMFRAIFGYFRARIWTWAWKQKCSQMSVLQLLFCPISVFSSRIWIIKISKSRSCLKPNWCMFNILDLMTSLPPSQLDRSNQNV